MKNRVIIIGLDGATWKVLSPLIKQGKLPFIKQLIKSGCHGKSISTIPSITAPAWVTFQTGVNPGKHSIYDFYRMKNKSRLPISSYDIKVPRFWEILHKKKKRSIVINMPV